MRWNGSVPGTLMALLLGLGTACGGAQASGSTQTTAGTYGAPVAGRPSIENDTFISGGSGTNAAPTTGLSAGAMGTAPTQIQEAAPPVRASSDVATLSDGQIAQLADTANSGEIEQARLAIQHATNARVKAFAQHMLSAHTLIGQRMTSVLQKESIVPAISAESATLGANARNTLASLKSSTSSDFDAAYVDAQVKEHQEVLDMFDNKLIPGAQDAPLRAALQEVRPMVAEHLGEAKDIQRTLPSR
jgi:putative membrane protein